MAVKLAPGTLEYVKVTVVAQEDIHDSTVQVADMVDDAIPALSDWATPATVKRPTPQTVEATLLVQAGLVEAQHTVWVAIGDHPERVVKRAGTYVVA